MYGYIYETVNLVSGRKYIGQHKSEKFDDNYIGSGVALTDAIKKYGKENFQVSLLCECSSRDEMNKKERYYTDLYNCVESDDYYNLVPGGGYVINTYKNLPAWNKGLTAETDGRVKQYSDNRKATMYKKYGKLFSNAEKANQTKSEKKYRHYTDGEVDLYLSIDEKIPEGFYLGRSKNTRQKISKASKGRPSKLKGRKFPEKHEKLSLKYKGRPFPDNAIRNSVETRRRPVLCVETGQVFTTLQEAGIWAGYKNHSGRIPSACLDSSITAKGYHWKFVEK